MALIAAGAAHGDEGETYKSFYKDYLVSLEAGNAVAAQDSALAAWMAAETELGSDNTTAILAYNYASLVYRWSPQLAKEPLARVFQIID